MSQVNPGDTCLVAGWGKTTLSNDSLPTTLQEVELTVQDEQECKSAIHAYSALTEICVGDPKEMKICSEVRFPLPIETEPGKEKLHGKITVAISHALVQSLTA